MSSNTLIQVEETRVETESPNPKIPDPKHVRNPKPYIPVHAYKSSASNPVPATLNPKALSRKDELDAATSRIGNGRGRLAGRPSPCSKNPQNAVKSVKTLCNPMSGIVLGAVQTVRMGFAV